MLPGNKIRGKLPSKFECKEGTPSLVELNLNNNMLSGDIPRIFFTLETLKTLDFSKNRFRSLNNGKKLRSDGKRLPLLFLSLADNRNLSLDMESFSEYAWQKYRNTLQNLNLNNCGIQGKLAGLIWWFSSLLTLDLSNNQFSCTIPGINGPDNVLFAYLDLSNNNFTGSIPHSIYSATNLQYFNTTGNAAMSDGGGTGNAMNPTFLRTDFQNMQKAKPSDNFTCPQILLTFNGRHVHLDPSYYGYRYCVCDDGHYGASGVCHECMSGAVCKKPKVEDWKDLNKSVMIMNEGFWPLPKPGNVSHLRRCFSQKACNPSGDCSCSLQANKRKQVGVTGLHQPLTRCKQHLPLLPWQHWSFLLSVSRWILQKWTNLLGM